MAPASSAKIGDASRRLVPVGRAGATHQHHGRQPAVLRRDEPGRLRHGAGDVEAGSRDHRRLVVLPGHRLAPRGDGGDVVAHDVQRLGRHREPQQAALRVSPEFHVERDARTHDGERVPPRLDQQRAGAQLLVGGGIQLDGHLRLRHVEQTQLRAGRETGQAGGQHLVASEERVRDHDRVGRHRGRARDLLADLADVAHGRAAGELRVDRGPLVAHRRVECELGGPPGGVVADRRLPDHEVDRRAEAVGGRDRRSVRLPLDGELLRADRGAVQEDREVRGGALALG